MGWFRVRGLNVLGGVCADVALAWFAMRVKRWFVRVTVDRHVWDAYLRGRARRLVRFRPWWDGCCLDRV